MGVTDLRMMGLRDKTVEFEDDEKMVEMMQNLIADTNPSLVITFYPNYAVHPDHDATGRAMIRAITTYARRTTPNNLCTCFFK